MPKGIYIRTEIHKHCGFQRGHKINLGKPSPTKGIKWSLENRLKLSKAMMGRIVSPETRDKIRQAHLGMKPSAETLLKLSTSHLGQIPWNKGKKGVYSEEALNCMRTSDYIKHKQKNAVYPDNFKFYSSHEWRLVRNTVYNRDKYICQECKKLCSVNYGADKICCHHINYNINDCAMSNLITLCTSCHMKTNYQRDDWIEHFRSCVL